MSVAFDSTCRPTHDPARKGAPDLYQTIHKGLRNALQANLIRLGRLDVDDPADIEATTAELEDLLEWLHEHLTIEETFVHAAIEQRSPLEPPAQTRHDHEHHQRDIRILQGDCRLLASSADLPGPVREALARQLYLCLGRFVGENLVHMTFEETVMNTQLWKLFSDKELHAIHGRIMASITPPEFARAVRWMIPALNPTERAAVVKGARATIDPVVFGILLAQIRSLLDARDREKLERALDDGDGAAAHEALAEAAA